MREIPVSPANGRPNIENVDTQLSREIKRAMTKSGLSGPELAKRAGVGESWVRQVRTGRIAKPAADKLERVARQLGLDPRALLAMTDQLGRAPVPPVTDQAELIRALQRQAEAMDALVVEIRNAALAVTGSQAAMPELIRTELAKQRAEMETWVRSVAPDEAAASLTLDPTRDPAETPAK